MTFKEKFIRFHRNRGYHVEDLGKIVVLRMDDYRALHFFNADGSRNEKLPPQWSIGR